MHGWIVLDKPLGMSSAHAVDKVKKQLRKITRDFKIGHAGTLDPLATGVLVLAVGEATKLINYAMDAPKEYAFTVTWGQERDTDDGEGVAIATSDKRPSEAQIEAILPQFTGPIQQVPPIYSAIKQEGRRAYDMARSGEDVVLKAREVTVHSLAIIPPPIGGRLGGGHQFSTEQVSPHPNPPPIGEGETTFLTHCSKGTYIRSLARDMGRMLGCYGYVSMLRRTKVGKLTQNDAISLEKLEEMVHKGALGFLAPPQALLDDILAISLNAEETSRLKHGQRLPKPPTLADGTIVACMHGEDLVALVTADGAFLKPERVFNITK